MATLTKDIIEAAIAGFLAQRESIDAQVAELRAMLAGTPSAPAGTAKRTGTKRKLSPEALERIREGQKRRWAAVRGEAPASAPKAAKKKRRLSAEGRKAIVAALKKRWAAKRAAGG